MAGLGFGRWFFRLPARLAQAGLIVGFLLLTALSIGEGGALVRVNGAAWPIPAIQTRVPAIGPTAISGSVVDGSNGRPIPSVIVTLGSFTRDGAGIGSVMTDDQGRFVFTGVSAGIGYFLNASRFGYLPGVYGPDSPESPSGVPIILHEGDWFSDLRLVLWRPSAISGTVTDEAGEPVVDAYVRALASVMIGGRPQLAAGQPVKTDDRGRYRLSGLTRGRYLVMVPSVQAAVPADMTPAELAGFTPQALAARVEAGRPISLPDDPALPLDRAHRLIIGQYPTPPPAAQGQSWVYPATFWPSTRTTREAEAIDLGHGEERAAVDIRLAPLPAVRVTGRVVGSANAAPGGMLLRLLPNGSEGLGLGGETATALVTADGAFTLLNVPPGMYTIVVSNSTLEYTAGWPEPMPAPAGFVDLVSGGGPILSGPPNVRYAYRTSRGGSEYAARLAVTVGEKDLGDLIVALERTVRINGRIAASDGSQDPPRVPTRIWAEPASGDATLGVPRGGALAGDPFRFSVPGLLGGEYVLTVLAEAGLRVRSIMWQGRDYANRPFDASGGHDFEDVVITLTSEVATMTGRVVNRQGVPAKGAAVIAFPAERDQWTGYGFQPRRIAWRPAAGTFIIDQLPAGDYFAIAVDESVSGRWQDQRFLAEASTLASRVTLRWGETTRVDLTLQTVRVAVR